MTKKNLKIMFEEGCFDSLEEEMTQDEIDELVGMIEQMVADGSLFENSTPVDELPEDEQEEIYNMINNRKNTRQ